MTGAIGLLLSAPIHAGTPMWTFSAPSPASVTVSAGSSATVQYTVTNQANKSKRLFLKASIGLSASSCNLAGKGSTCALTLTVDGSVVPAAGIHSGPILCEEGNPNQCYQPSQGNQLNITLSSQQSTYSVTPSGDGNETISPSAVTQVSPGATQQFTVTANTGYTVSTAPPGGTCPFGSWSGLTYTTGPITEDCSVSFSAPPNASIYVITGDQRIANSINTGSTWNSMLNQVHGTWNHETNAIAVDSSGTMYMASGLSGLGSLVYTLDGVNWSQMGILPDSTDWADSLFALNTTLWVGTGNGNVLYTTNYGSSWSTASPPDGSSVSALFVSSTGTVYAGTVNGSVFSSANNGATWIATSAQPDGSAILSLAVDIRGTLYVVTQTTKGFTSPLSSTDNGATWTAMGVPSSGGTAIAVLGTTVYVSVTGGSLVYTTDNGMSWTFAPSQPSNSISYLVVTQKMLSPLFVEAVGVISVNGGSASVTITNLSDATATNVQAQLPASLSTVVQDSSNCASVAPQGTCTLNFTSTQPYAPQNLPIVGTNTSAPISRMALAFSINGYLVYNVDASKAYVVDVNDANGSPVIWSSNGTSGSLDYTSLWGIAENSTVTIPFPNGTDPAGMTATQYAGQSNCVGATDGACSSANILAYYNNIITGNPVNLNYYAAGLCAQSTVGGASAGDWYLPSICELTGALYYNGTTLSFSGCAPTNTGILSLYGLGISALSGMSNSAYWTSTEMSNFPTDGVWSLFFGTGGGGGQLTIFGYDKSNISAVRCVRAVAL